MNRRCGKQTVALDTPVYVISYAAVAGVKEGEGPLRDSFDLIVKDDKMAERTWELAESAFVKKAVQLTLDKAGLKNTDIDYVLSGDLQNQCAAAHYGLRDTGIPFFGLYGACSTMTESISLGALLVASGFTKNTLCVTSSHFCSAEKQYRNPLEYGGQRTPTAQWTVTAAGGMILSSIGSGARITSITTGRIVDKGISDITNMGAAMAPAALDTITAHFKDTGRTPTDYDLILTGDLGVVGSDILCELAARDGFDITSKHDDCGRMIYDIENQDVHAGGSGCGCCASVLCSHIMNALEAGKYKRILVAATGALMNPVTVQQGETIPAIAHAIVIER
ncbi:MAG: stage V sporulation protein AD [Clostridia bacterium]|nr:stage V sporulation protein AD [Clostridia bacterium]